MIHIRSQLSKLAIELSKYSPELSKLPPELSKSALELSESHHRIHIYPIKNGIFQENAAEDLHFFNNTNLNHFKSRIHYPNDPYR